jgi:uncharacterized membrane protein
MTTKSQGYLDLRPAIGWRVVIGTLIVVVLVSAMRRVITDVPNVVSGQVPDAGPDRQYSLHPALAYVHIGFALPYLVLAPLQLWRPFRERHYPVHRRIGRTVVPLALMGGLAALVFGLLFPVGGPAESAATLVFGSWFLVCLTVAWRSIRAGDVVAHRRWMVRAFAMGVAVGTIRVWIGIFSALGLFDWYGRFAAGFWLAFLIHAAVGEWWLRTHPHPWDRTG